MRNLLSQSVYKIVIIMIFVMLIPLKADAATFQSSYLTFSENEDGTLTVTGYDRSKHESPYNLKIQSQYTFNDDTYSVSSIGDSVFKGYTFYSIYVESGISVGDHAFENITVDNYKTSFSESESVYFVGGDLDANITIGDYAFANAKFYSVARFERFSSVGDHAFENAIFTSSGICVMDAVSHIGNFAFYNSNITGGQIVFKDTEAIGNYAFYNTNLRNFDIYLPLHSIGEHAFIEDQSIIFTVHSYVTDIRHLSFDRTVLDKATFFIHEGSPLAEYLYANYVTYNVIETGVYSARRARIGEELSIDNNIAIYKVLVTSDSTASLTSFVLQPPSIGYNLESCCYFNTYPYSITHILPNAFSSQSNLRNINLYETSITHIEENAFTGCSNLRSVVLPNSIQSIGENAFPNSKNLHITIPANVTDIQNFDISNLTNVVFVINKKSPLASTLSKMNLTYQLGSGGKIVYPRPKKGSSFSNGNLQYKITSNSTVTFMKPTSKNIVRLAIPTSVSHKGYTYKVTKINAKACHNHKKLKTVTIGDNVTQVGDSAFANCGKLKTITFGKNVKKLGKKVLYNNKRLTKIKFQGTKLQSIGKQTFRKVPKKVDIIVPTSKVKKYSDLIKKAK